MADNDVNTDNYIGHYLFFVCRFFGISAPHFIAGFPYIFFADFYIQIRQRPLQSTHRAIKSCTYYLNPRFLKETI